MSDEGEAAFRSGFVTLAGRANVGKSTLMNRIVGTKVSIVSDRPQTTRNRIHGVFNTDGAQVVFLDTPGIHKPQTLLGERLNRRALDTLGGVDAVCFLVEAHAPIGRGDRFIAEALAGLATPKVLVVNKVDRATPVQIAEHLAEAQGLGDFEAYVPLSARTGDGVGTLAAELVELLPAGPRYYPEGEVTDQPETFLAAEIVREKLLAMAREELPHSIAVVVDEVEERREDLLVVRAEILVERPSQKAIVIGRGGEVLKRVGTEARHELEALLGAHVHLETRVKIEPDWQRRAQALDRLGY